jgi:hypothetical protein
MGIVAFVNTKKETMYKWAMLFYFRGEEVVCEYVRIREQQGDASDTTGNSQVWLILRSNHQIWSDPWMESVFIPAKPSLSFN